jgi:predicted ArsR family transcriptional regulator
MAIRLRTAGRRDGLSRSMIEQYLADAPAGLSVDELADRLGRHPNTVRGHLDVLVSRGQAVRVADQPAGPGRPRHRYLSAGPPDPALAAVSTLAAAVAEELGPGRGDPAQALRAGERWARQVNVAPGDRPQTPDESVGELVETMRRAGFGCDVDAVGDRLQLTHCPYGAMVETAPAICTLHLYLAQATLAEHDAGVGADRIDVDAAPGLCVLYLPRPDRTPRRVVSHPPLLAPSSPEPGPDASDEEGRSR